MAKKSLSKFLSKIFLGELSKIVLVTIIGVLNLPTLLLLVGEKLLVTLKDLFLKSTMQWQLSEWLLLTSLILSYSFLIIIFSIKIHKYIFNKRKFLLFTYKGYEWQMSLPDRKVPSYPNCPKHHVYLSVYIGTGDQHLQKCPFCDVSFPAEDNVSSSIEARSVGIAILEGRYKG